jgi:hypothetical protein
MLDMKSLEGTMITGLFRPLDGTLLQQVKLHRVEQYGVWIESQAVTEKLLSRAGVPSSQKTGVLFLPWSEVILILGSVDAPALSETAFGL